MFIKIHEISIYIQSLIFGCRSSQIHSDPCSASHLGTMRGVKRRRNEGCEMLRCQEAVGEAWPVPLGWPWSRVSTLPRSELHAFDAPTEPFCVAFSYFLGRPPEEINYGPLLREVLLARGWRYSCQVCHGVYDKDRDKSTFYVREFEACLRGKTPAQLFGRGVKEDGYRLQALKLPRRIPAIYILVFGQARVVDARSATLSSAWQVPRSVP